MEIFDRVQRKADEIIEIRRDIHTHPELDFDLFRTSNLVKKYLENLGIQCSIVANTGVVATIIGEGPKNNGKTIAIRADMDALPITEKNTSEYCSVNKGVMHACGHDAHTAIALGAAKVLSEMKSELNGNVKFIFEPAEETTGGARIMIEQGALENPQVHAIIGCHVDESLEAGTIGVKRGVAYASSNPFTIKIIGKSTHGASPHKGIDPITIACNVINALQTIVSREINPTSPAVITVGTIHGGTAQNIVPDEVTIGGIIRTLYPKDRKYVKDRVITVVSSIVEGLKGKCEIKIDESYPCVVNDDRMYDVVTKGASKVLKTENIKVIGEPTMGVESFSYFSLKVPAMFYWLGCGNKEKGIVNPIHSSNFDIDERCLSWGIAVHCSAVITFLNEQ